MKKEKQNIAATITALLFMLVFSSAVKAQCSGYQVSNSSNCALGVTIKVFDGCGPYTTCNSYNTTVPPNSTIPLSCGTCTAMCDIKVIINTVAGTTQSPPITCDLSSGPGSGSVAPACGAGTLTYFSGSTTFKYQ